MTVLWILLAILYVACWVYFGLATFRQGHYWLFWIGFIFPLLWIIGGFIAPTVSCPRQWTIWIGSGNYPPSVRRW